jgi:hypothetical protein
MDYFILARYHGSSLFMGYRVANEQVQLSYVTLLYTHTVKDSEEPHPPTNSLTLTQINSLKHRAYRKKGWK